MIHLNKLEINCMCVHRKGNIYKNTTPEKLPTSHVELWFICG